LRDARVVRVDDDGDDDATRGRVDVAPIGIVVVVVVVVIARARWTREETRDGGWVSIRCGRACATTTTTMRDARETTRRERG